MKPFRSILYELAVALFYTPKIMSSFIVSMFWVLCMLQFMFYITCGCVAEERIALIHIRSSLIKANYNVPASWGQIDDCCSWERVTCNNDSARVSNLDLSSLLGGSNYTGECWNLDLTIFSTFKELQLLDLSWNWARFQNLDGM